MSLESTIRRAGMNIGSFGVVTLGLSVAVVVAGCAPKATSVSPEVVPNSEVAGSTPESVAVPLEGATVSLARVPGHTSETFIVSGNFSPGEVAVTPLANPDRLVLDLPPGALTRGESVPLTDSLVAKVRTAAHADKSRLVFDLAAPATFTSQGDSGTLALTITPVGPRASEEEEEDGDDKLEGEESERQVAQLPGESASPRLVSLNVDSLGNGENMLIAELTQKSDFQLQRTAPSEYVLTLRGATLDESAASTIVAPPDSGLIRSVRPVRSGEDVTVRIFTSPTSSLRTEASGSKIVVIGARPRFDQFRAQADPAVAAAEGEDSAATPASPAASGSEESSEPDLSSLLADTPQYTGRLISLDLQDTDIDNALRIIAEVSNLNIIASDDVTGKVTLRLIDVPWDQALDVILKTNNLDKVQEGNVVRIAPVEKLRQEREQLKQAQQAEEDLEPLVVRYVRVSYSKASELKPLVETVLSERGTVTFDERTNQLIVKDIRKGVRNVAELIAKVDLRTPQVLLETQIVEATRSVLRDLGSRLGFNFVRSPATGNATGFNFPNTIAVGGVGQNGNASSFPAAISAGEGSGIDILFGSADGSATLRAQLTALEREGRVRVVSRPAVATTNNKPAMIKSVEKIRVKTPSGGVSVATGAGAAASGSSTTATEAIEIGIQLEVTPQASPDYYVLLDVEAKSSTFGTRTVEGIPSEIERSANSTVLVSSGQTFAMGGIYKLTDTETVTGVPFLKDVPVFGTFFRRNRVDNSDEELLFFITPRIIEGSFDDAAMKAAS